MSADVQRRPWSTRGGRYTLTVAIASLALAGCTGTKMAKLPMCDGKHRRDANPYGSFLPGSPIPPVSAPPTPGRPVSDATPNSATRSAARAVAIYPSC